MKKLRPLPRSGSIEGVRPRLALCALLSLCLYSVPARSESVAVQRKAKATRLAAHSRSLGYPWRGRLERGVLLRPSEHVQYVASYRAGGRFYGTAELVHLLQDAARQVATHHPGAKLALGELSRSGGGDISDHASHENGRDVDLAFYMVDARGRPAYADAFLPSDPRGRIKRKGLQDLLFDDKRNWQLIAALLRSKEARVQRIFICSYLKRRLLHQGRKVGAAHALLEHAARVMVEPAQGHPHRNHFHVRIYCAPADRPRCKDSPPFHSFDAASLANAD